jgi:hypothetical protein
VVLRHLGHLVVAVGFTPMYEASPDLDAMELRWTSGDPSLQRSAEH